MIDVVVDLGNTRLKWGLVSPDGAIVGMAALPVDDPTSWRSAFAAAGVDRQPSRWAVGSVNPAALATLQATVASWPVRHFLGYQRASQVPQPHRLASPDRTGADRALGVFAARGLVPPGAAFQVVSCGSAITVDLVDGGGTWRGGAIAPGLPLASRALHQMTAQLPLVAMAEAPPSATGDSTVPAIRAGLLWGLVGSAREILARQAVEIESEPHVLWTGGDAGRIAPWIAGETARIIPDLVLRGLARLAIVP